MSNILLFPNLKKNPKINQRYIPRTNLKELEIAINDEEVDEAIYYQWLKISVTRASEIEKLKSTTDVKKDTLMDMHLELMRSDPVYRNKVLTEVHQMICLNALSIRKS